MPARAMNRAPTHPDRTWVALKPICEHLGISAGGQIQVIKGPAFFEGQYRYLSVVSKGGPQRSFCITLRALVSWLVKVQAGKGRPEVQDRIVMYQLECCRVLNDTAPPPGEGTGRGLLDELIARTTLIELGHASG